MIFFINGIGIIFAGLFYFWTFNIPNKFFIVNKEYFPFEFNEVI